MEMLDTFVQQLLEVRLGYIPTIIVSVRHNRCFIPNSRQNRVSRVESRTITRPKDFQLRQLEDAQYSFRSTIFPGRAQTIPDPPRFAQSF